VMTGHLENLGTARYS